MSITQSIKLDQNLRKRLKVLGVARKRTTHWLMRTAIENYLEHEENYEREKQEDLVRWERYQQSGKAVRHSQASQWLKRLAKGKAARCPKAK